MKPIFMQFEEDFAQPFERIAKLAPTLGFQRLAELAE